LTLLKEKRVNGFKVTTQQTGSVSSAAQFSSLLSMMMTVIPASVMIVPLMEIILASAS